MGGFAMASVRRPLRSHRLNKAVEQIGHIVRAWTGFGMPLKTERRPIGPRHTLQAAVEQRNVGYFHVLWQAARIYRQAMILAGDQHLSRIEILDWMIGAVVAEFHFHCLAAGRQAHQLMAKADAESW